MIRSSVRAVLWGVLVLPLAACASAAPPIAGTVQVDTVTLAAPLLPPAAAPGMLPSPAPSSAAAPGVSGVSGASDPSVAGTASGTGAPTAGVGAPLAAPVRVVQAVGPGTHVAVGDTVARVDDSAVTAALRLARSDAAVARSLVTSLESRRQDVATTRRDLTDQRATLDATIAQLTATRSRLAEQLAAFRAITAPTARQAAPTPTSPDPPSGAAAQPRSPAADPVTALAALAAGLQRLDTGLAQARTARARLDAADARLVDAEHQLDNATELARLATDGSDAAVRLAEEAVRATTVTTPVAGTVTHSATVGDVLAAGATLVDLRPDGASTVTAWVTPAAAQDLCAGTPATVRADWLAGTRAATVTVVGDRAELPPSSYAGEDIHLTRAVALRLTAEGDALPAGAPLDLVLGRCPTTPKDR
ncbi:HlyD family efflux transporter periplasmic adaptor subunit [Raineyella sp. LH-20]|uniref:HlyD family efflux transporter periplasmic adaptor subunit n=1 Tax=Raineyella sp. LH-20 TaxID=3081204 RepID=UPI002954002F|nr:HlyD family efflux transporter periplasmic adaptor subunit [Raineyella sp. LH-20]WOP18179.1 HlyD family efflux transporter periplasmic adaptor subunit [Raineyella sp. LH-20]